MNEVKKTALAQQIGATIDLAIEFGKAIQRHDDAHDEMMMRQEDLMEGVGRCQRIVSMKKKPKKEREKMN